MGASSRWKGRSGSGLSGVRKRINPRALGWTKKRVDGVSGNENQRTYILVRCLSVDAVVGVLAEETSDLS